MERWLETNCNSPWTSDSEAINLEAYIAVYAVKIALLCYMFDLWLRNYQNFGK